MYKKYRIIYWYGSILTDYVITADSEEEAIESFQKRKGAKYPRKIKRIEEI